MSLCIEALIFVSGAGAVHEDGEWAGFLCDGLEGFPNR